MPWNELLLPLLAGYVFINICNLTRFRAQRHDGYRLVIECLFFGVAIFAGARFIVIWIHALPLGTQAESIIQKSGLGYPFLGTGILATVLALVLALIGNLVFNAERAKKIIVKRQDNGFMRLFHKAAIESRMVSVTLSSKKVYIGYILSTPNLSPGEQFVGILPIISGYRDKDTLRLVTTTNYGRAIDEGVIPPEDFEVTVALASVEIANFFDPDIFSLFDQVPIDTSGAAKADQQLALPLQPPPPDGGL